VLPPSVDTIAAIATAQGRGGIGVIRLSGGAVPDIALHLLGKLPIPRYAGYSNFPDAQGTPIDEGIALYFDAPHSYTGEHVLELQGHGGTAVLQLLLQRCLELGARLAEPGEFTRRAFLNGKLDLAQAESVADLIEAGTAQAARSAMRSLQGDFSITVNKLVDQLIALRMLVEAMIDFPEEDIDALSVAQKQIKLATLQTDLAQVLYLANQGSLLKEGGSVVLVGPPNVGKSSLLNCLSGEDAAIVSDIPGTTRDIIQRTIQIDGIQLHILDTAGLRNSQDTIEQMGIDRTHSAMLKADVILLLWDASQHLSATNQAIVDELSPSTPKLHVFNKIDLLNQSERIEECSGEKHIYLSAKTGAGVDLLKQQLLEKIGWHQETGVFLARERHVQALLIAQRHVQNAANEFHQTELFAENLRLAQNSLCSITGVFTADDLLGEIFSRFCIGK
jgi:tRNA modification GTPase